MRLAALALLAALCGCATLDRWALEAEMKKRRADNVGEKIKASPLRLKRAAEHGLRANDYSPRSKTSSSGSSGKGYVVTGVRDGVSNLGNAFLEQFGSASNRSEPGHKFSHSEKVVQVTVHGAWDKELKKAVPGTSVLRMRTLSWDVDMAGEPYHIEETDDIALMKKVRDDFDMYMKSHPEGGED